MPTRMRLLVALVLCLVAVPACHKVVRDANAYRQELRYFKSTDTKLADQQLTLARAQADAGNAAACAELAELALVVKVRNPWHADKALANAGVGDDPGPAPDVPKAAAWCADPALAPIAAKVMP